MITLVMVRANMDPMSVRVSTRFDTVDSKYNIHFTPSDSVSYQIWVKTPDHDGNQDFAHQKM